MALGCYVIRAVKDTYYTEGYVRFTSDGCELIEHPFFDDDNHATFPNRNVAYMAMHIAKDYIAKDYILEVMEY